VDESDKPMRITKRPRGGVFVMLNKAVPPEEQFLHRGKGGWLVLSKKTARVNMKFETSGDLGNVTEAHLVQVWAFAGGRDIIRKDRGMDETTDAGRIELRIDK